MPTPTSFRRQYGGTVIGLIAGLVIGLAIALGVALYITKAPLPFMNRFQERPSSAASGAGNWNPNQGLSGATQSPPAGSGSMPVTVASKPLSPQALAKLGQPGAGASQPEAAPAAGGTPAPTTAAKPAAQGPVQYVLQVGAYSTRDDAERQRAKVALIGQEAHVDERVVNGRTLYRVRVGPFTSVQQAEQTQKLLGDNGVQTALVRTSS
ncbi:SPOR domain-containing protein [Thiomonas intermedia]|uniref:SPOR domain-containing protein n=1 Tax=Thiomonas intermedia TaxID=926 RepID=UPI0009A475F7|nr:SPOR domain-containing protein [Thiomonas intermedia]